MAKNPESATTFFSAEEAAFASNYDKNPCFRDRLDLFVAAIQRTTPLPAKVLDFGCGPGTMALAMARLGYDVVGVDGASGMIEAARVRAKNLKGARVLFELADAASFDKPGGSFDAVVCSSVLEYLDDDLGALRRLAGCLLAGGHLIVSVPCRGNLFAPLERVAHFIKLRLSRHTLAHLTHTRHRYSRRKFLADVRDNGMEVVRCTSFECPIFGDWGIKLSRCSLLGRMLLVEARKGEAAAGTPARGQ